MSEIIPPTECLCKCVIQRTEWYLPVLASCLEGKGFLPPGTEIV